MLLKHSYPLFKHIVSLFRSFAKEKTSFMGVDGGKNTLLLKSQISIIVNRSLLRRYLCISCFGILVFVFGSVWEVEWVVGRDKCQSVGLRKQSLLLPRQLPPLTPRATNPQGPQHNLCTDHPCQVGQQEENGSTSLLLAHLALLWLLVVGWWGEKLSWVGARSPLPGAVTLYGVYTSGAKTPAQGHGREAQGLPRTCG